MNHRLPFTRRWYALLVGLVLFVALPPRLHGQVADRALSFGTEGVVILGDPQDRWDLAAGIERTFGVWIRYTQPQYHAKILNKRRDKGWAMFVHQYSGALGIWVDSDQAMPAGEFSVLGTAGLRRVGDGTWHHAAMVYDGSTVIGYVDGEEDLRFEVDPSLDLTTDEPLLLGWNQRDIIHFAGEMDELSIWERALDEGEIRTLMYRGPEAVGGGLIGYWPMDEEEGVIRDRGPLAQEGTLVDVTRVPSGRPLRPPFRERLLFRILAISAVVLAVYLMMRVYALGIARRARWLEGQVAERTSDLAEANEELAQSAEVLRAQKERLAEVDQAKSHFFTSVSHEFRTPLTLILGPLRDIVDGRWGPVSDELVHHVRGAEENGRRLLALTNRLLELARLEAGALRITVHPIDLARLLERVNESFAPLAERRSLTLTLECPQTPIAVYGDPERLETIFTNLVANAVKFTPAGGRIGVKVEVDGGILVHVSDSGPGVPEEDLEHLFDRFYQSGDVSGSGGGSGIGLALVRELAELHGGSVAVRGREDGGAVFTVRLQEGSEHLTHLSQVAEVREQAVNPPLDAPSNKNQGLTDPRRAVLMRGVRRDEPRGVESAEVGLPGDREAASPPDEADATPLDPPIALVVDDHADMRGYVRSLLESHYRVVEAADGKAALALARTTVPDIVVSDVAMPVMDGLALVAALHADPELSFVPVLLLTARAELNDRLAGLGSGADAYLAKPFQPRELAARVENLISQRSRLREQLSAAAKTAWGPLSDGGKEAKVSTPESGETPFAARVRTAVVDHLTESDFGVEDLAASVFMERTGLYRRMVDELETTPSALIREMRLDRAAELLRAGDCTVLDVAYAVGYRSVSSFSRRFSERFGCSPAGWARSERTHGSGPAGHRTALDAE